MRKPFIVENFCLILIALLATNTAIAAETKNSLNIQLGPRPFFLLDQLATSDLKQKLSQCQHGPFKTSAFSIAHRGAPLQFPEHTKEAYVAAARMGAGVIECDVTFTKDKQLVCRHAQCDLHRTTDILLRPVVARKCSIPFSAADASQGKPATARCCTSDITLAEYKSLSGKMDAANLQATSVEDYVAATPSWQTDLYSATGTLMTFAESIELFQSLNVKMMPELKSPEVDMPFDGFTQEDFAKAAVQELEINKISPKVTFLQSFSFADVEYWIEHHPQYGQQAIYLDDRVDNKEQVQAAIESLPQLKSKGLSIIAPPLWALLSLNQDNQIVPSEYALAAKAAGLDIITWTLERSGHISRNEKKEDYYYQSIQKAIHSEGDIYRVLNVLHNDIGILGVFSDWPATVTYYANCFGLE